MPWEKQFDVDSALTKAMNAFWAHGYEATSMQDLIDCMGINRGSVYDTFGSKRSLFIRALKHYDDLHRGDWVAGLSQSHGPKESILAAFDGAISAALGKGGRDGCLLVNTALELSPHDKEISRIVAGGLKKMEKFFAKQVAQGQLQGEIPDSVDPKGTAAALLSLFIGLRVLARSRPEAPLLRAVARQARAMLE